jgi:hypothetical protein
MARTKTHNDEQQTKFLRITQNKNQILRLKDRFETTNILMAVDNLNQHGPLSTAGHAYIIRLNPSKSENKWEFINPGE